MTPIVHHQEVHWAMLYFLQMEVQTFPISICARSFLIIYGAPLSLQRSSRVSGPWDSVVMG